MDQDEMLLIIEQSELDMEGALEHLANRLNNIRTGKASPAMLQSILVNYYGSPTPLSQVSNVTTVDAKTLMIQPWEKSIIGDIEKAIFEANIGLTPRNDGEVIHINIPPLTEDRRKDYVKQVRAMGEDAKISLRSARHKAMEAIKKAKAEGLPEDYAKRLEEDVDKKVKDFGTRVDGIVAAKEEQLMTV